MNLKVDEMRNAFEMKLVDKDAAYVKLSHQVAVYRAFEKEGNVGITFDEMNCNDIVEKLKLVTDDPLDIWNAFGKHFGKGFFNYPIERDFGITPDSHQRMINKFDNKILEFKELSDK